MAAVAIGGRDHGERPRQGAPFELQKVAPVEGVEMLVARFRPDKSERRLYTMEHLVGDRHVAVHGLERHGPSQLCPPHARPLCRRIGYDDRVGQNARENRARRLQHPVGVRLIGDHRPVHGIDHKDGSAQLATPERGVITGADRLRLGEDHRRSIGVGRSKRWCRQEDKAKSQRRHADRAEGCARSHLVPPGRDGLHQISLTLTPFGRPRRS